MKLTFPLFFLVTIFLLLNPTKTFAQPSSTAFNPVDFAEDIKPIFDGRCVQCHSCYNSPCQLKLSSVEGIQRGLIKDFPVYDNRRLKAAPPSRLGIDRNGTKEWRNFSDKHSFKPITFNYQNSEDNLKDSFIYSLINHKQQNSDKVVDDLINYDTQQSEKSRSCPDTPKQLKAHMQKRPNAGMPYGMPALDHQQIEAIRDWTLNGSPLTSKKIELTSEERELKTQIENYFNQFRTETNPGQALRKELVSRYLYEHLFLSHIYLTENDESQKFFRLVRTNDHCDADLLREQATRRPWNSAGDKFNYCLKAYTATLVHKTHIVYKIDQQKLQRWDNLFFAENWQANFPDNRNFIQQVKDYFSDKKFTSFIPTDDKTANNPMVIFKDIPVKARYQFLLDDARYHIMTFIRGPVCKGNTAVNSIDENFYVYFIKPDSDLMVRNNSFYLKAMKKQQMPAYKGSDQVGGIIVGKRIRRTRNKYRKLRSKAYQSEFPNGYSIDDIWNGETDFQKYPKGLNPNASLTVLRHFDAASVLQGAVGAIPKTMFVLDYSILQRLVYTLVTGFDVFSDLSHQVHTRIYMSYLRMEAEENFLNFFPPTVRQVMRKSWYTELKKTELSDHTIINRIISRRKHKLSKKFPLLGKTHPTSLEYPDFDTNHFFDSNANEQEELLRSYRKQFVEKINNQHGLDKIGYTDLLNPQKPIAASTNNIQIGQISSLNDFEQELSKVTDIRAMNSPWVLKMPSTALLLINDGGSAQIFTLMRSKEHFNLAWISGEDGRRNQAADTIVAYKGVGSSYPNHIFSIDIEKAQDFLETMIHIENTQDYDEWVRTFGNPRSGKGSENFWQNSDQIHQTFKESSPIEYGAFDYNRYGIDYRFNKDSNEADPFYNGLPRSLKKVFEVLEK